MKHRMAIYAARNCINSEINCPGLEAAIPYDRTPEEALQTDQFPTLSEFVAGIIKAVDMQRKSRRGNNIIFGVQPQRFMGAVGIGPRGLRGQETWVDENEILPSEHFGINPEESIGDWRVTPVPDEMLIGHWEEVRVSNVGD